MDKKIRKKRLMLLIILAIYVATMLLHVYKPLPEHISYESPVYQVEADQVNFYYNLTGKKEKGKQFTEQIVKRTLEIINEAEDFIVMDVFLFNSYHNQNQKFPHITEKITEALIQKKRERPHITSVA